jgi:hypothetical protein
MYRNFHKLQTVGLVKRWWFSLSLFSKYSDRRSLRQRIFEDPMVMVKLDILNAFGSLSVRLVLNFLSDKVFPRDYECEIKTDKDFETVVHELRKYFGFFKFSHTCDFVLLGLSRCFTVPYPCKTRKITSHQRNSKRGFVCTHLSLPPLSLS